MAPKFTERIKCKNIYVYRKGKTIRRPYTGQKRAWIFHNLGKYFVISIKMGAGWLLNSMETHFGHQSWLEAEAVDYKKIHCEERGHHQKAISFHNSLTRHQFCMYIYDYIYIYILFIFIEIRSEFVKWTIWTKKFSVGFCSKQFLQQLDKHDKDAIRFVARNSRIPPKNSAE